MLARFRAGLGLGHLRAWARAGKSVEALAAEVRELKRTARTSAANLQRLEARHQRLEALVPRLEELAANVREVSETVHALSVRESQLRAVLKADAELERAAAALPAVLDEARIVRHLRGAVERTDLRRDPFPHIVVEDVFPPDFYAALLRAIPPTELFGDKARNKEHVNVPLHVAPVYSRRVWNFLVYELRGVLQRLLLERFREPLGDWLCAQWPSLGPDPFAPPMEFNIGDGRIMRRGRGYYISPHRDPKWGFLIGILYLAQRHDSERWGTQLFAVNEDAEAVGAAPHWIDPEQCRLVADVPYRPNTMLVLLNSSGAHGAHIPEDAEPADLRRHIYQFRIGPSSDATRWLTAMLSEDQRRLWAGKVLPA